MWRRLAAGALVVVLGFAAVTAVALEAGGGVAVLETRREDGGVRRTHVWFVEHDGELWVEAGTPENGWFLDVQRDPELVFRAGDRVERRLAEPSADRGVHAELRKRLRSKYGWRDRWVGLYVDQTRSSAVRLAPAP